MARRGWHVAGVDLEPKMVEYTRERLKKAGHTGSLLTFNAGADASDALLRLEEMTGRQNLIVRYPDEKWAYRKQLRKRMKTKSGFILYI